MVGEIIKISNEEILTGSGRNRSDSISSIDFDNCYGVDQGCVQGTHSLIEKGIAKVLVSLPSLSSASTAQKPKKYLKSDDGSKVCYADNKDLERALNSVPESAGAKEQYDIISHGTVFAFLRRLIILLCS